MTSALRQFWQFMAPGRKAQFVAVFLLMLAGGVLEVAAITSLVPFLALMAGQDAAAFGWLVALLGRAGLGDALQHVGGAALLFMAAALIAGIVRLLLAWASSRFVFEFGHDLTVEITRRILHQPYSFHTRHNSSEVLASLEKTQVLVSGVLLQLMQAAAAAVLALFVIAALIRIDPFTAAAAAIVFGALYLLVSLFAARRLAENSGASAHAYGERLKMLQESLGGIRDVIIDHSQAVYLQAFRQVDHRLSRARASTWFIGAAPRFAIESAGIIVIATLAMTLAARPGGLTSAIPILGAMALGAMRLLPFVQQLYTSWTSVAGNRALVGQVVELLGLPVPEGRSAARLPALPFTRDIRFEAVTFSYPGRRAPALRQVTLAIPRGARVAVIGRSGSGKSTFADLLMGLLEPSDGQITIDGAPLEPRSWQSWRQSIAHVPQSIFLADDSIARNIAFGRDEDGIDPARLARALRVAQLDDMVAGLPAGVDTLIGEGGVRLSGGQRQRLGIARAIYKDAPVLVLDEATNALDEETEADLLRALDAFGKGSRTMIIITHRHSAIAGCSMVVTFEAGGAVSCRDLAAGAA